MKFTGYGDYIIEKDGDTWYWRDTFMNSTIAQLVSNVYNYPFGLNSWYMHKPICGRTENIQTLLLTVCNEFQFTCGDGTCVHHKFRCDTKFDCRDHTDEDNCKTIILPSNYKVNIYNCNR